MSILQSPIVSMPHLPVSPRLQAVAARHRIRNFANLLSMSDTEILTLPGMTVRLAGEIHRLISTIEATPEIVPPRPATPVEQPLPITPYRLDQLKLPYDLIEIPAARGIERPTVTGAEPPEWEKWWTYKAAAERVKSNAHAIRCRATRRKWPHIISDSGHALIQIPREVLNSLPPADPLPATARPTDRKDASLEKSAAPGLIKSMKDDVEALINDQGVMNRHQGIQSHPNATGEFDRIAGVLELRPLDDDGTWFAPKTSTGEFHRRLLSLFAISPILEIEDIEAGLRRTGVRDWVGQFEVPRNIIESYLRRTDFAAPHGTKWRANRKVDPRSALRPAELALAATLQRFGGAMSRKDLITKTVSEDFPENTLQRIASLSSILIRTGNSTRLIGH